MGAFKQFVDTQFLTEAASQSLGRVISHIGSDYGFGVVTPFRKSANISANFKLLDEAESIARKAGFGFFKVRGYWYEEDENKKRTLVEEISLFIPNKKGENLIGVLKDIADLSKPRQDGFIYSDGKTLQLWEHKGEPEYHVTMSFDKTTTDTIEGLLKKLKDKQIYAGSAIRDRKKEGQAGFFFESFWVKPESSVGAMSLGKSGYIF